MPATEAELTGVLKEASTQGAPVTVIGAGSGLTGGRVAKGGWVLSLEKFRALEILEGNARAGAAITLLELRDAAAGTMIMVATRRNDANDNPSIISSSVMIS